MKAMEIITVNDGSTGRTKETLQMIEGIKLIHHPCNRGYEMLEMLI